MKTHRKKEALKRIKNRNNKKNKTQKKGGLPPRHPIHPIHPNKRVKPNHHVGWKQLNCSPAVKGETVSDTSCMVPPVLEKIKKEYNKDHPTQPITSTQPAQIWQDLHTRLNECRDEKCWLKIVDDSNEQTRLKEKLFRPDQPKEWEKNPDEWLSNYDIFNVVKQYEDEYPDFKLLGPSAIDFDAVLETGTCVNKDICQFSLKEMMKKKKRNFGFCFNLDKHTGPGTHWVSLYLHIPSSVQGGDTVNTNNTTKTINTIKSTVGEPMDKTDHPFIFYFDSAGNSVPKEVRTLMDRIAEDGKQMVPSISFRQYNNDGYDHQKGNTECGMYSIFFIITMLIGNTPFHPEYMTFQERIDMFIGKNKKKIDDTVVFDYRDLYFNK